MSRPAGFESQYASHDAHSSRFQDALDVGTHPSAACFNRVRLLVLASYPVEAAGTRYRILQYIAPLRQLGVDATVDSFLDSKTFSTFYDRGNWPRSAFGVICGLLRRLKTIAALRNFDVVMVLREAMLVGPPITEWVASRLLQRPLLLDIDDAVYIQQESQTYGKLARLFRSVKKTERLIQWADFVCSGNAVIARHVRTLGAATVVMPTIVDTARFTPRRLRQQGAVPVLGWIGSHSTYRYLISIVPALREIARRHPFRLRVVGGGDAQLIQIQGVEVECLAWSMEREISDFQSLDIGLYPIVRDDFSIGKSGLKAIQYMTVGVPFVVSPVGVCESIGVAGRTHFAARSVDEWVAALTLLIEDVDARIAMGDAGRRYAEEHFSVADSAAALARVIHDLNALRLLRF